TRTQFREICVVTETKNYLVYCNFSGKNTADNSPVHKHFEFVVPATSADEAEAFCKERFARLDGELFQRGDNIYVDNSIEFGEVPKEGIMLRYAQCRGELSSIRKSLPLGDADGEFTPFLTWDPEAEHVEDKPFVTIGEPPQGVEQTFTEEEKRDFDAFRTALKLFLEKKPLISVLYVDALLAVALNEGGTVNEYALVTNVSPSVMSRHLLDLSDVDRQNHKGLALVITMRDLKDPRITRTVLSAEGKELMRGVLRRLKATP